MPNIKSAKKRVEVTKAKTMRNKMAKSLLKTTIKKAESAIADGDRELASGEYKNAVKRIDKAVAAGILHRNTAARRKSALTRALNEVSAQ